MTELSYGTFVSVENQRRALSVDATSKVDTVSWERVDFRVALFVRITYRNRFPVNKESFVRLLWAEIWEITE